ncbi:MAG: GNAT family N-acetyltransferase [Actinomycetaceae bacterium]|nr:GNAT family N-acetyltransferase [Actinomycetaceae bacterium]
MIEAFEVQADGIVLSPMRSDDIRTIAQAYDDPQIQQWTSVPVDGSLSDAQEFYESYCPRLWKEGGAHWIIRKESQGAACGSLDMRLKSPRHFEIGYLILDEHRGQKLGEKAVSLACDTMFTRFNATRITWKTWENNWKSWRVAWKCGFQREGVIRDYYVEKFQATRTLWIAGLTPDDKRSPATTWDGPGGAFGGEQRSPSPSDPEALVKQFHHVYGLPIVSDEPTVDYERVHMRMSLIFEEVTELTAAMYGPKAATIIQSAIAKAIEADEYERDLIETADALADLVYVIYGMCLESGINLPAVLEQVQASNMSKLDENGQPIYREDGKVLKGRNFFEPKIAAALKKRVTVDW